jgi:hypothetical protein
MHVPEPRHLRLVLMQAARVPCSPAGLG